MMENNRDESSSIQACPSETAMAGRADVCVGCPGRELCAKQGQTDPDQKYIDVRMRAIKRKILVLSGKGGVGKSSVAAGLSTALASMGHKVGLLDVDICGPSAAKLLAVEGMDVVSTKYGWTPLRSPHYDVSVMSIASLLGSGEGEGLDCEGAGKASAGRDQAVVWRGPRKTGLIKRFLKDTFWGRMEYLIFDTPPGTSDEHLSVVKALMNSRPDGAIIVTTPQEVALATICKEISFCKKMGVKILGLVENMSSYQCPCCSESWSLFSSGGTARLAAEYQLTLLATIPIDPDFVRCCEEGRSIFKDHPDSTSALSFMQLADTIHSRSYESPPA